LTVGELIELLNKYYKNIKVSYIEDYYGITPIVGVSEIDGYINLDGAC